MKSTVRLGVLFLLAATLTGCTTSQRVRYLDPAPTTAAANRTFDLAAYEQKYGDNDAVFLFTESTIEHSGSREKGVFDTGKWMFSLVHRRKYVVFNPDVDDLTTFHISYSPDNLYIIVTTPDGEVRRYGAGDLREGRDSDGDPDYTIVFPDVVRGTLIEEGWDWECRIGYPSFLEEEFELRYRYPCERSTFVYACPDWWTLDFKDTGLGVEIPVEYSYDTAGRKMIVTCEKRDVPALAGEPYSPRSRDVAEYIQFQVTSLAMIDQTYRAPQDWSEFAKRFQENALAKSGQNADKVADHAKRIVADAATPAAKIKAVRDYIRDEIALGGRQDGDYLKVMKNGEGGLSDIAGLTCALLNHVEVPARLALVHVADEGHFDPTYIAGSQFSVPGVQVEVDGAERLLLPYLPDLPLNFVPEFVAGQPALIIDQGRFESHWDGPDTYVPGSASLGTAPGANPLDDTTSHTYDLVMDTEGGIAVTETITTHGNPAYRARGLLRDLHDDEREDIVKGMASFAAGEIVLSSYEIANLAELEEPLVITAHYDMDHMVTVTPEEAIFHTGGLFSPLTGVTFAVDTSGRQNRILIPNDEHHTKNITFHLPAGWSLTTALADFTAENDFGSLEATVSSTPGELAIAQGLHLKTIDAAPARFPEFLELVDGRAAFSVPALVFTVAPAGP